MAARIGKIELVGLEKIYTEDTRSLVKQRGPGQTGGVFQDLGREPITVVMEGLLLGDDTQAALEELRQAHARARPLSFAADVIAGADLTHVLIADLQVRQLAGHTDRYAFFLRVREYTEPPEPAGAGAAHVQAAAVADAAAWQGGALDAAAVKQDPGALMGKIAENPGLVAHLDAGELSAAVDKNADRMSGKDFGVVLGAVGKANPAALEGMIGGLKKKGRLGEFIDKLVAGGVKVLDFVKGIKLDTVLAIFKIISDGANLWTKVKDLVSAAGEAIGKATAIAPARLFDADAAAGESGVGAAVAALERLLGAADALLRTDGFAGLVTLVKQAGLQKQVAGGFTAVADALRKLAGWLATLGRVAALPRIAGPFLLQLEELDLVTAPTPDRDADLLREGYGEVVTAAAAGKAVAATFRKLAAVSEHVIREALPEQELRKLRGRALSLWTTCAGHARGLAAPDAPAEGAPAPRPPQDDLNPDERADVAWLAAGAPA